MDTGSSKALFALCKFFFCFVKSPTVNKRPFLVRTIFSLTKFSQLSPNFKDAVERAAIFCHDQATLLCSLTAILFRDRSIDVSCYTKNFACLRCEQGWKNEKSVITKFSNFFANAELYFSSLCEHGLNNEIVDCFMLYE